MSHIADMDIMLYCQHLQLTDKFCLGFQIITLIANVQSHEIIQHHHVGPAGHKLIIQPWADASKEVIAVIVVEKLKLVAKPCPYCWLAAVFHNPIINLVVRLDYMSLASRLPEYPFQKILRAELTGIAEHPMALVNSIEHDLTQHC